MTTRVNGGTYEPSIRLNRGFNVVSFKMDVAFTDQRAAEQFYADLECLFEMDVLSTLTYDLPPAAENTATVSSASAQPST